MGVEWLIGWKAIATYLGVSVRTAQNYHEHGKMPVRSAVGMNVRAIKMDLDVWHDEYTTNAAKK